MKKYIYLKPSTSVKGTLFEIDPETGKHREQPPLVINSNSHSTCREGLIGYLRSKINSSSRKKETEKAGVPLTVTPRPPAVDGKASMSSRSLITYRLGNARHTNGSVTDYYSRICLNYADNMTTHLVSEDNIRNIIKLMDALVGAAAMLIGDPKDFHGYSGPLPKAEPTKVKGYSNTLSNRAPMLDRIKLSIEYNGISGLVVMSPIITSILVGLGRNAIELCLAGKYEEIDEALDIDSCIVNLKKLRRKKELSEGDRRDILDILEETYKHFLTKEDVNSNPGAYPINKYTWELFKKFIEEDYRTADIRKEWGRYNLSGYDSYHTGFHSWCYHHKDGESIKKSMNSNKIWSGNSGTLGSDLTTT